MRIRERPARPRTRGAGVHCRHSIVHGADGRGLEDLRAVTQWQGPRPSKALCGRARLHEPAPERSSERPGAPRSRRGLERPSGCLRPRRPRRPWWQGRRPTAPRAKPARLRWRAPGAGAGTSKWATPQLQWRGPSAGAQTSIERPLPRAGSMEQCSRRWASSHDRRVKAESEVVRWNSVGTPPGARLGDAARNPDPHWGHPGGCVWVL